MTERSEWKKYQFVQTIGVVRGGWRGVWDAIVAAVTREDREIMVGDAIVEFYARHGAGVDFAHATAIRGVSEARPSAAEQMEPLKRYADRAPKDWNCRR